MPGHLENTDKEAIEEGRLIALGEKVESGSMRDALNHCAYLRAMRARVERYGCCGKMADAEAWLRPGDGKRCCLHTRKTCLKTALARYVKLWSTINRKA